MGFKPSRILFFYLLFISFLFSVGAQGLDDWYDKDPQASFYRGIRPDLLKLMEKNHLEDLPERLLYDRLREGVQKKVPAQVLLNALWQDLDNFLYLRDQLRIVFGELSGKNITLEGFLTRGGIVLRSGVSRSLIPIFLDWLRNSKASLDRGMSALLTVTAVQTRFPLEDELILDMTRNLTSSQEPEERFPSLSGLFTRGRSVGLSPTEMARTTIIILGKGGTFLMVEQEFLRRSRK